MYVPRFRRIETIVKEIKKIDPDTALNWRMIKQLISQGEITKMKIGNAWLVNIDELYSIFYKEKKNENNNSN
jgi:hypothetical protein